MRVMMLLVLLAGSSGAQNEVSPAEEKEIVGLIRQLGARTDSEYVQKVYESSARLTMYGRTAWPQLIKHIEAKLIYKNAPTTGAVTKGGKPKSRLMELCYMILWYQLFVLPDDYVYRTQHAGVNVRIGIDGRRHPSPLTLQGLAAPFGRKTIGPWLRDRSNRSLREIQIEALEWLIAQEWKIGFGSDEDKERFLYPLERKLNQLRAAPDAPLPGTVHPRTATF